MVLDEDIVTTDGNFLIRRKATELTERWLERIDNYARTRGSQKFVTVQVPGGR